MKTKKIDIVIDFESEEAYYMQIRDQVIRHIAYGRMLPGQQLPSVRQLAEQAGINMHTVRKAYNLLKEEGYLRVDNRRGAAVDISYRENADMDDLKKDIEMICAKAKCKGINAEMLHTMLDKSYMEQSEVKGE